MKKFCSGIIVGLVAGLILASATFAFAADQIRLIVNGNEVKCDVPPQIIDNRVLVPARALAEALGATVEWDEANRAVYVSVYSPLPEETPGQTTPPEENTGAKKVTPIYEVTPEGYTIIGERTETDTGFESEYKVYDSEGNIIGGGGGGGGKAIPRK